MHKEDTPPKMNCSKKKNTCYYYYGQYGMYYQHLEEVDEEIQPVARNGGLKGQHRGSDHGHQSMVEGSC